MGVLVSGDEQECCCRVSDRSGEGIPVKDLAKVWSYFYTTAQPIESTVSRMAVDAPVDMAWLMQKQAAADLGDREGEANMLESPLAGLGCGLPLCRLYAEYLGGSIELQTMPKFGSDVFVYLRRLEPGCAPSTSESGDASSS